MSITPAFLAQIKTAFYACADNHNDDDERKCGLCQRRLEIDYRDFGDLMVKGGRPWQPDHECVPWTIVADRWLRATGHADGCPIRELANTVLALEEYLERGDEEEVYGGPEPPALTPRTMARVAMHFCGWAHNHAAEDYVFLHKEGDNDDLNWDDTIDTYERALGGEQHASYSIGDLYGDEWLAGRDIAPLPPREED